MDTEHIIASHATLSIWDFFKSKEQADAYLPILRARLLVDASQYADNHIKYGHRDSDYWLKQAGKSILEHDTYRVMTLEEFEQIKADKLLSKPIIEITEEKYDEALNVLPPLRFGCNRGVTSFFMSEFHSGTYTSQYAKIGCKYYCKLVDYAKSDTWIQHSMVLINE